MLSLGAFFFLFHQIERRLSHYGLASSPIPSADPFTDYFLLTNTRAFGLRSVDLARNAQACRTLSVGPKAKNGKKAYQMPEIEEQRAKQGREGKQILTILIVSLSLLAVVMIGYLIWVGTSSPTTVQEEGTPAAVPLGSPANPANPIPTAPPGEPGQAR